MKVSKISKHSLNSNTNELPQNTSFVNTCLLTHNLITIIITMVMLYFHFFIS